MVFSKLIQLMLINVRLIFCIFFLNLFLINVIWAQPWHFVKETDGIKIYTRNEPNSSLKSYKGEVIFHAPMQKTCSMIGNARNIDWWGPEFMNIKVLAYEDKKFVQYYYTYDMPWPFTDRDIAVNATVKSDTANGEYSVLSLPLLKTVPEKPDLVRIKNYWQRWTIKPLDHGNVQLTLEGIVDPGGNVTAWLYNMLVTEMPIKTIHSFRARVLSPKPAN